MFAEGWWFVLEVMKGFLLIVLAIGFTIDYGIRKRKKEEQDVKREKERDE